MISTRHILIAAIAATVLIGAILIITGNGYAAELARSSWGTVASVLRSSWG
jgi:archaellin